MINTMQQIGGSIGVALLSSFAAASATHYVASHGTQAAALAAVHSYHTVFWISAGIFLLCATVSVLLFRNGPPAVDREAELVMVH
jgi:hypothetical protein